MKSEEAGAGRLGCPKDSPGGMKTQWSRIFSSRQSGTNFLADFFAKGANGRRELAVRYL